MVKIVTIEKSRYKRLVVKGPGANSPGNGRTVSKLRMFEPIILPIASSSWFFKTLVIEAASSGRLVPSATIVRPIIAVDTPSSSAISEAA